MLVEVGGLVIGLAGLLVKGVSTSSMSGFEELELGDHPVGMSAVRSSNDPLDLRFGVPISE